MRSEEVVTVPWNQCLVLLQPLPSSDAACRAWLPNAACPASSCAPGSPRGAFLAPRTVAASRSRRSSTARSCRLPSCRSRAHPLRHSRAEDPVGLSRRGRRPTSARAVGDDVLRLGFAPRLGRSSALFGGPTRLPRAVRVEKGPRELGRLRLAAARAALTAPSAGPPTWVWGGVDPGRFRPMCATHDFFFKVGCPMSRLTPPRSHAVVGRPVSRRNVASASSLSTSGRFFPALPAQRTSDTSSPCCPKATPPEGIAGFR